MCPYMQELAQLSFLQFYRSHPLKGTEGVLLCALKIRNTVWLNHIYHIHLGFPLLSQCLNSTNLLHIIFPPRKSENII